MPEFVLRVGGEAHALDCDAQDMRRLEDLAAELETRLAAFPQDVPAVRRLALTALSLLNECQQAGAAAARAHVEIDRLQDVLAAACQELDPAADSTDRGVLSLLRPQGAA